MSENVDTRIVEMQFDDAQFKAGVKDTIAAIKDLDNALELENGASGFDNVVSKIKGFDVSSVTDGVSQVESRFSSLQHTAINVINGISSAMKGGFIGGGIVGALSSLPVVAKSVSGGMTRAAKLAQAEFQFKGLGVQGEQLTRIMNGVSESVNDTAYSLDQAANVASMLFASGVKDADQLTRALSNVSGVAATFNADYNTIADIFTKVASKGKLQGQEFQRLAVAGINGKAVIAEYLQTEEAYAKYSGIIDKYGNTEAAMEEMSKAGVISFDLLVDAMDKFKDNAFKSNETLSGVTANIGSALSRTTADFFQYVLHNTEGVIALLNQVRFFINNINKATNDLMHVVKDEAGNVVSYGTVIQGVLDILKQVTNALDFINNHNIGNTVDGLSRYHHRWKTFFSDIQPLLEGFFERVSSMAYHIAKGIIKISSVFREAARIIVKLIAPIAQAFDEVFGDGLTNFAHIFDITIGEIIRFLRALNPSKSMVQALHDVFKVLFTVIEQISKVVTGAFIAGFEIVLTVLEAVYEIVEVVVQVFLAFADAISPVTDLIGEFFGTLTSGQNDAGKGFLGMLKDICLTVRDFAKQIQKGIPKIKEFFKPLRSETERLAREIKASGVLDVVKGGVSVAIETIGRALSKVIPLIQNAVEFLAPVGEAIGDTFVKLFESISNFANDTGITSFFSSLGSKLADFLGVSKAFADTGDAAQDGANGLDAFGQRFGEAAVAARDGAIEFGGHVVDGLVAVATTIWNIVSPAIDWIMGLFSQLGQIIGDAFANSDLSWDPVLDFFNKVGKLAEEFFKLFEDGVPSLEDFGKLFSDIGSEASSLFSDLAPQIGGVLGQIGDSIQSTTDGPLASISGIVSTLVENIQKIPDAIANIPSGVGDMFTNIFNGIGGMIKNPFAVEKAWADTGEGDVSEAVGNMEVEAFNLSTALNKITKFLKTPVETARDTVKNVFVGGMKGIGDAINEGISAINFETITLFIENLKNVGITLTSLWGTFALVSVFESIREIFLGIANWTTSIDNAIKSFGKIGDSISGVFKQISTTIDELGRAVAKDMAANRFLKYMLGTIALLGTIVAAIIILGRQPQNELIQGGIAVGVILGVLLLYQTLMLLISRINNTTTGVATLAGLTGMGLALMMVARAIGQLGTMDRNELIQGGIAVGVLMIVLGIVASAVGALSKEGLKGAIVLITLGIMLKTLALTISGYALMPWEVYNEGMEKIIVLLLTLVVAAVILSRAEANVLKAAGAILVLTAALHVMVSAIGLMNLLLSGDPVTTMGSAIILVVGLIGMAVALSKLSAFEGSLIKSAVSVGILTACLLGIALAIGALNLVTLGNPVTAVVMGAVLIGMLFAMAKSMQLLGNKTRQLPNATKAIFNMTIALAAITACLAILTGLASWNLGGLVVASLMLVAVMAAFVGAIVIIGRYGGKIEAAIPAIWNMTLAIAAIGAAISAMMLFSGGNVAGLAVAGLALAGTLIVMAAAIALLSKNAAGADMAATALLEMAGAIAIMAISIALLGSMPLPQIVQGFIGLLLAVVILGVAAAAVTALSEVFIVFDGILAILAISLVAIAAAFYLFVAALAELSQIAPEAFQSMIDSKDQMIGAFAAMGEAIAAGIQSFFAALIFGVDQGMTGVSQEVDSHGPEIGAVAMSIGKALGEGIIFGFGGMILGIGQAILEGVGAAVDFANDGSAASNINPDLIYDDHEWSEAARETGQTSMEGVKEGAEQSDAPEQAGEQAVEAIQEGAEQAAEQADSSELFNSWLGDADIPDELKDQLSGQFSSVFESDAFGDLGLDLGGMLSGNVVQGASDNPIDIKSLLGGMNLTTASFDGDAQEVGTGIGNSVSSGAATSMANTTPVNSAIDAQLAAISARSGDYDAAGIANGSAYNEGNATGIGEVDLSPAIAVNTSKMASALGPARKAGESVGHGYSSGQMTGIRALSNSVAAAARSTIVGAGNSADGRSAGHKPGQDFSYGMASGINSAGYAVRKAAMRIVKNAMDAAKKEADSNSPSKKMIEQGEWFGQGFAIGIKKTGDLVNQNAAAMVTQAMDEVKESFGIMDTLLDVIDWDANPTITPVLDLTDYEAGIRRMNQLNTQGQVDRVGWADRIWPTSGDAKSSTSTTTKNHVEVHLDWNAGTTPNQMAMALANELEKFDLMEA